MNKYKILSKDSWSNTNKFLIDTENDLSILPKSDIGSTVFVIETGDKYILNNDRKWIKFKKNGSSESRNNSENEIISNGSGVLVLESEENDPTKINMDAKDIYDAVASGTFAVLKHTFEDNGATIVSLSMLIQAMSNDGNYGFGFIGAEGELTYASTGNVHPAHYDSNDDPNAIYA